MISDDAAAPAAAAIGKDLTLRMAIGDYDRTRPLMNGSVKPDGVTLTSESMWLGEFCLRPIYEQFDVSEMSFSLYVAARARGEDVIALPVFPLRMQALAYMFCRADAPFRHPSELIGKRIGSLGYRYTLNLWLRGILKDRYGVAPEQVTWVTTQQEDMGFVVPAGVDVRVAEGRTEGELLLAGEIDAVFGAEPPLEYLQGDPRIRRFFPDAKAECAQYFKDTGFFPATHVVVMNETSWKANKWAAVSLVKAFREAQRQCDAFYYENPKNTSFPDTVFFLEEQRRKWGANPWPTGVAANRSMIETFVRYAHEQGYIDRPLSVEELFAENTLDLSFEDLPHALMNIKGERVPLLHGHQP